MSIVFVLRRLTLIFCFQFLLFVFLDSSACQAEVVPACPFITPPLTTLQITEAQTIVYVNATFGQDVDDCGVSPRAPCQSICQALRFVALSTTPLTILLAPGRYGGDMNMIGNTSLALTIIGSQNMNHSLLDPNASDIVIIDFAAWFLSSSQPAISTLSTSNTAYFSNMIMTSSISLLNGSSTLFNWMGTLTLDRVNLVDWLDITNSSDFISASQLLISNMAIDQVYTRSVEPTTDNNVIPSGHALFNCHNASLFNVDVLHSRLSQLLAANSADVERLRVFNLSSEIFIDIYRPNRLYPISSAYLSITNLTVISSQLKYGLVGGRRDEPVLPVRYVFHFEDWYIQNDAVSRTAQNDDWFDDSMIFLPPGNLQASLFNLVMNCTSSSSCRTFIHMRPFYGFRFDSSSNQTNFSLDFVYDVLVQNVTGVLLHNSFSSWPPMFLVSVDSGCSRYCTHFPSAVSLVFKDINLIDCSNGFSINAYYYPTNPQSKMLLLIDGFKVKAYESASERFSNSANIDFGCNVTNCSATFQNFDIDGSYFQGYYDDPLDFDLSGDPAAQKRHSIHMSNITIANTESTTPISINIDNFDVVLDGFIFNETIGYVASILSLNGKDTSITLKNSVLHPQREQVTKGMIQCVGDRYSAPPVVSIESSNQFASTGPYLVKYFETIECNFKCGSGLSIQVRAELCNNPFTWWQWLFIAIGSIALIVLFIWGFQKWKMPPEFHQLPQAYQRINDLPPIDEVVVD